MGYIYCLTNKYNQKRYIGQTRQELRCRLNYHFNIKNTSCRRLNHAIKHYGRDAFIVEVLLEINNELLNYYEDKFIEMYSTRDERFGYNLMKGGNAKIHSDETKKLMSESRKGEKHGMYGKQHTEETRKKMKENHKGMSGRKQSEETKEKIRQSTNRYNSSKLCTIGLEKNRARFKDKSFNYNKYGYMRAIAIANEYRYEWYYWKIYNNDSSYLR